MLTDRIDYTRSDRYWDEASRQEGLDPDQVASHNPTLPLTFHRAVRARQIERLRQLLAERPERPHVLDLGCGPGVWACELAPLAASWLGVDIAPAFVHEAGLRARREGWQHLAFREGTMLEVPRDRKYDAVLLGGILGLLNDDDIPVLMERVRSQLLPGGMVYVRVSTVPAPYPTLRMRGELPINYRRVGDYRRWFGAAGFTTRAERDAVFTESMLATAYAFLARKLGLDPERALDWAGRGRPLTYGLASRVLDLTPMPRSTVFVLGG